VLKHKHLHKTRFSLCFAPVFFSLVCGANKTSFSLLLESLKGDKLTLKCHICGTPPLKIQWMKDRRELTSVGSTRISFSDGTACLEIMQYDQHINKLVTQDKCTLLIQHASRHDSALYSLTASNSLGTVTKDIKLSVLGIELLLLIPGFPGLKQERRNFDHLFCEFAALRGKPQPEVKWTKDKAVGDNPRLSYETGPDYSKFLLTKSRRTDTGKYIITATNAAGTFTAYANYQFRVIAKTAINISLPSELSDPIPVIAQNGNTLCNSKINVDKFII
uniref:Ig-like domain-containing protein n=1 Tax=Oryzias latipes TaxID=8090 RepID=A0A3P9HHS4_ORYLA